MAAPPPKGSFANETIQLTFPFGAIDSLLGW